jgi:circadian clock protein KaiB
MAAVYELTLFVSGATELSARAIAHARELCDVHLDGLCRLSVVDVHEDTAAVLSSRVVVAPTLVRTQPLPVRRFVGDLSQTDKVLLGLELATHAPTDL